MKVAIFGATGGLGRHLVPQALARGHAVTALVRDPAAVTERHERLALVRGDALDPARVGEALNVDTPLGMNPRGFSGDARPSGPR